MRLGRLILVALLPLMLMACKLLPPLEVAPTAAAAPLESSLVVEQSLLGEKPVSSGQRPKPRPNLLQTQTDPAAAPDAETVLPLEVAPAELIARKSRDQVSCEKRGGVWGNAGKTNGKACVKRTRDAGKQCRKQGDCTSLCLARSGTCAPVKPLFGCNDILQKDGSRVTLCVD